MDPETPLEPEDDGVGASVVALDVVCMDHKRILATVLAETTDLVTDAADTCAAHAFQEEHADCGVQVQPRELPQKEEGISKEVEAGVSIWAAKPQKRGRHFINLPINQLTEGPLAETVKRFLFVHDDWKAEHTPFDGRKRPADEDIREAYLPVTAHIRISAYLQDTVPEALRVKTVEVRSEGEIYVESARMFAAVYAEDHRLGGDEPDPSQDVITARVEAREKAGKMPLVNRGKGPYIWGHDFGDLVFEGIDLVWNEDGSVDAECWVGS